MITEQDQHCATALILRGTEKIAYMREHGLTSEQVWRYSEDCKDTRQTRAKTKKTRSRALAAQDGACALCGVCGASRYCLDRTGKVVCGGCHQFLAPYRKLRAAGVELEDMREFEIEEEV